MGMSRLTEIEARLEAAIGRVPEGQDIEEKHADLRYLLERVRELEAAAKACIDAKDAAMRYPVTEAKVRASMEAENVLRAALTEGQSE